MTTRLTADEWDAVRWAYSFVPDERKTDGTPAAAIIERLIDLAHPTNPAPAGALETEAIEP